MKFHQSNKVSRDLPSLIKLQISHPECCLSVLITLLMAFIPLTWYWVRTSSRLLFPTWTWNTFSNLFSPPKTATENTYNILLQASAGCLTCSGKKASPAICSNFCNFAIRYFLSTAKKWIIREKWCTQVTFLALCKLYPSVCWIFLSELVAFSCSNH